MSCQRQYFDQLNEKIDQVVLGRRYIIAEIGKLKVSVEDFRDAIQNANFQSIADAVGEMKNFMQMAVSSLGQLKSTLTQLGNTVANLNNTVDDTLKAVQKGGKGGAGGPAPAAPMPGRAPVAPKPSAPVPSPKKGGRAAPPPPVAEEAPEEEAAAPEEAAEEGGDRFSEILGKAKGGTTAKDLGLLLDGLRSALSKENPLNPILFELSMEAGRLKSLGNKKLSGADLSGFEIKVNSWKAKSG